MSDGITPSFAALLNAAANNRVKSMFGGWLPGQISTYNASTRKASIALCLDDVYFEDGARFTEPYPIINEVPVQFPGSDGVRISWPVAVGDYVTVLFAARSIDRWLQVGGSRVDPGDDRDHDLNDAIAIPGLLPFNAVKDATPMIEFTSDGKVQVGGAAALMLLSEFLTFRTWVVAQFSGVGHVHATPSGNSTGTTPTTSAPAAPTGTTVTKGA